MNVKIKADGQLPHICRGTCSEKDGGFDGMYGVV